ncbi:MAG TPA: hypothetical protein PLU85_08480 [Bacteroidia bacterium]|nr:hypothetical protein [Bacteroidia bacterium]MBP7714358.1 hypothetical protein [Bacteroidia bacterium]MBP8668852.1 hypothetical protein [Bacteroidia bacterium]HOZ82352.1 hypothetical protein [Bacteroidia bacterium]HOZ89501.1 hypothetical protein [Bacteroidia bacterium]
MKTSKLNLNFFIVIILIAFFSTGCSPIYYVPSQVNMPSLTKGGDAKFSASFALPQFNGVAQSFDGQLSYSPVKHLGVTVDGLAVVGTGKDKDYSGSGKSFGFALGYYNMIDENLGVEFYAGYGGGDVKLNRDSLKFFSADVRRFYIQPGIYRSTKRFNFGIAFRFSNVQYSNLVFYQIPEIGDKIVEDNYFFYEPSFYCSLGGNLVKVKFQLTPSFNIDNKLDFNRQKLAIGLGVDFLINRKNRD